MAKRQASNPELHLRKVTLRNWRNFREVDLPIGMRMFLLGPNASGKSNLLDALRFLRDLTLDGGGLQEAVRRRGGLSRIRNLAARNFNRGRVTIAITLGSDETADEWQYELSLGQETRGQRRAIVGEEKVRRNGEPVIDVRPDVADRADAERLTQTALEQVNLNRDFRPIAEFLRSTRYLHLVPQVIREPDRGADRPDDPYGGDFLARVAKLPEKQRASRLAGINKALQLAVPQLENLSLEWDEDKKPHLIASYKHWRPGGAKQDEKDFSDGTLRLIGLLWSLQERSGAGPVLLEEPELSLHPAVVRHLPSMMWRAAKATGRQVLATTHAHDLLEDEGLGLDEVVLLTPGQEGTEASLLSQRPDVVARVEGGLTLREALAQDLAPDSVDALSGVAFA